MFCLLCNLCLSADSISSLNRLAGQRRAHLAHFECIRTQGRHWYVYTPYIIVRPAHTKHKHAVCHGSAHLESVNSHQQACPLYKTSLRSHILTWPLKGPRGQSLVSRCQLTRSYWSPVAASIEVLSHVT